MTKPAKRKPLVAPKLLDHPEHFADTLRAYQSCDRDTPEQLRRHLLELAAHHCTICRAPWLEIHHIQELSKGGKTEYDNLIVLCSNCHSRVHQQGIPTTQELQHYKLKQEIAYELPIFSRISEKEWAFLRKAATFLEGEPFYAESIQNEVNSGVDDNCDAMRLARKKAGFSYLESFGMVSVNHENCVQRADGQTWSIRLEVRLTHKGARWIKYLLPTGRLAEGAEAI